MKPVSMLDLSDVREGQVFHSGTYDMTHPRVKAFAAEFDPQGFHLTDDPEGYFTEQVASGWHTAAVTMRLFLEAMPLAGQRIGAGVADLKWVAPVQPDHKLRVEATVLTKRSSGSKPGMTILTVLVETYNQADTLVQTMKPTIFVRQPAREQA